MSELPTFTDVVLRAVSIFGAVRHSCGSAAGEHCHRELVVSEVSANGTDNKAAIVPDQQRINGIPFLGAI